MKIADAFDPAPPSLAADIDVEHLFHRLKIAVRGEVRFDNASRALYASDGSNYHQTPIGVVLPKSSDDVVAAMKICNEFGAPVLPRGGGTSLAGQCCNVAVVFDLSKYMNKILDLDPVNQLAWVEPGVILDDLRSQAEHHHLTFAPDPSTHNHNTIGGMIGNNSCGPHSVMGGRTSDNVIELEILTYDGQRMTVGATSPEDFDRIIRDGGRRAEIYEALHDLRDTYMEDIQQRYPDIPRRVSGYNLNDLLEENHFHVGRALVGSEGTCCMVLTATVRLVPSPPARVLVALGYPDIFHAADHIPAIMAHKPVATEGVDNKLIHDIKVLGLHSESIALLPEGEGWLLVEFGGKSEEDAKQAAEKMMKNLQEQADAPTMKLLTNDEQEKKIWTVRRSALGVTAHPPHSDITWEGWEDSAVPPEKLGDYLRDLKKLYEKYNYRGDLYGHFGQGCVHTRIDFDLRTKPGIEKYKQFIDEASSLVISYGGSLSGEHGDGQSKAQFLGKMFGERLVTAFQQFKLIWDPQVKMNPGKVVFPYAIDENLRLGTDYNPPDPDTYFHYQNDSGSFSRAMLRCVGVGECRKDNAGTMCPSYMATREEKHSTRGRAHLLFEMLQGEIIQDGWKSNAVKESLDLCLSCKGCAHECPVSVDMATYKAEFLAHHYHGKVRPMAAYTFGQINQWLQYASKVPTLANFFAQTAPFSQLLKAAGNIAQQRRFPHFAEQTFKQWFFQQQDTSPQQDIRESQGTEKCVVLWPDTFNNYLYPRTAIAATRVLQALGYKVMVPRENFCCGRPLYEFGMLNRARRQLESIFHDLQSIIREAIPIVVLEPSCASVFKDEMLNLFPNNEDAKRLHSQVYLLSDFLQEYESEVEYPPVRHQAIVHAHCHHKSVLGIDAEQQVLHALGLDFAVLDSGCCGMAGSFGFEKHKYEISIKIAERRLLPALQEADDETWIISNGFSCRQQIEQCSDRKTHHLSEVLWSSLNQQ